MKKSNTGICKYSLMLLIILSLFSCAKTTNKTMTVERDCTGTYLRFNAKDYHVCNLEMVSSFSDGAKVEASFVKIKECNGSAKDAIVCMMLHQNEGWIIVQRIQ